MSKQVLCEYLPLVYDREMINEAVQTNRGTIFIKAILQRANAKNQNGRIYPKQILDRELKNYQQLIQERRALGELDHPECPTINLKNVSHVITEAHWDGDDLVGTLEILSTPSGNIVKELMRNGIRLGVSSRGAGSVIELAGNSVEVDEDYNLICFDIVSNPSTQGAFLLEGLNNALIVAQHDRLNNLVVDFFSEIGR